MCCDVIMLYVVCCVASTLHISSVIVSDQLWLENSEIEAVPHGEFEYDCLSIATHTLLVSHGQLSKI